MATKTGVLYRIVQISVALPLDIEMGPFCTHLNQMFRPLEENSGGAVADWRLGVWDTAPIHLRQPDDPSDIFVPANSVENRVDALTVSHTPEMEDRLDEIVSDVKAREASAVNNGGVAEQVRFLRKSGISDLRILKDLSAGP